MKKVITFLLIFALFVPGAAARKNDSDEYLNYAIEDGIIFGDENGNLGEEKFATRAEFLALTVRFLGLSGGENVFCDVSDKDWFAKPVSAAYFCGIFAGFENGEARPMDNISVEDAVTILGRYYNATKHSGTYIGVSNYAKDYFAYAYENGFFESFNVLPSPKRSITKGEIVNLLYSYKFESEKKHCFVNGYPKLSSKKTFGTISLEYKLSEKCNVYYAICPKGNRNFNWIKLIDNSGIDKAYVVNIGADVNCEYDVYLKAETVSDGTEQIEAIKGISPLSYVSGEGTERSPYVIYSEQQLKKISSEPDKHYIIKNNIELSENWIPIENFSGNLNGNGYKISNLVIDADTEAGLFAKITGGVVENLTIDANISGRKTVGVIAGINDGGTIKNSTVTGNVSAKTNNCGGICGVNYGEIKDCLTALYTVKSGAYAGGICGQNYGSIENCLSASENVYSDMYAGGISGTNVGGRIKGCVAANIAVYNTMTYNSGKIATNQNGGVTKDNYSYDEMVSNTAIIADDKYSQNGFEASWEQLQDMDFYDSINWDMSKWKKAQNGYLLIFPKNTGEPQLEIGKTAYMPKRISTAEEFISINNNLSGYYVLTHDIDLKSPWKCVMTGDGFSGIIDGDGHTVNGLILNGESGLFASVDGGTIKNIKFTNVKCSLKQNSGIFTTENNGYIENCSVSGVITADGASLIGGLASINNGRIDGCNVNLEISGTSSDLVVGVAAGKNTGEISRTTAFSEMSFGGKKAVIGGICGQDKNGYLSENYASVKITSKNDIVHIGGICAMSEGSQIYKCASGGAINSLNNESYIGGIVASAYDGTVYNCFSTSKINTSSDTAFVGGIAGQIKDSNLQNTYACGVLVGQGKKSAKLGGICGFAEMSFVMQNVALNPSLNSNGNIGAVVGEYQMSEISDNFSVSNMYINQSRVIKSDKNGDVKSLATFSEKGFFTKPFENGGVLGWDEDAWQNSESYKFPILIGVSQMTNIIMPSYK